MSSTSNSAEDFAPCWGRESKVTLILNSDTQTLTFEIDGVPVDDIKIENCFNRLGGGVIFPGVCIAPLPRSQFVLFNNVCYIFYAENTRNEIAYNMRNLER